MILWSLMNSILSFSSSRFCWAAGLGRWAHFTALGPVAWGTEPISRLKGLRKDLRRPCEIKDFNESLLRENEYKVEMVAFERKILVAVGLVVGRGLWPLLSLHPVENKKLMSYRAFALTFVFTTQLNTYIFASRRTTLYECHKTF